METPKEGKQEGLPELRSPQPPCANLVNTYQLWNALTFVADSISGLDGVLAWFTKCIIKPWAESNCKEEVHFHLQVTAGCQGKWGRNMAPWLHFHVLLSLLFLYNQGRPPRGGSAHNSNNKKHFGQCPQTNLLETVPQLRSPGNYICQIGKAQHRRFSLAWRL